MAENDPDEPTPPRGIDADEYRRFLEFQRFQEYQRFVEAQQRQGGGTNLPAPVQPAHPAPRPDGPPAPRPEHHHELAEHLAGMRQQLARIERVTNPPTWQKILRNKWLHRALWLVILVAVASWGVPRLVHHYLGGGDSDQAGNGAARHPGEIQGSARLAPNPLDAVAAVYHLIAERVPDSACLEFTPQARAQFAQDLNQPTCLAAVRSLHAGLGQDGIHAYTFVGVPPAAASRTGQSATVSSCAIVLPAGPRLGEFRLTATGGYWEITGHSNEPDPCPAPPSSSASAPPT